MTLVAEPGAPAASATGTPLSLLFLFADTGGGHRASAAAVAQEVERGYADRFSAQLFDPVAEAAPAALAVVAGLYSPLIRWAPWAWGMLWHATDNRFAVRAMSGSVLRLLEPGLRREIERANPVAVVSFHPLLNHPTAHVLGQLGGQHIPFVTVVTDLVNVHASWTCAGADIVIAATPAGLDHCRRAGIAASHCVDLGLPVGHAFCRPPAEAEEQGVLRARLGLRSGLFTVLLTGGGEGSGGLYRRVRALLRSRLPIQLVVVCGRNRRLVDKLSMLTPPPPAELVVEGFVSNMAEWMRAADIVVTKAGPGTIAEAQCAGTPLLLTSYVPGQERGNVDFVTSTGTGRYAPGVTDMIDTIAELAAPASPAMTAMRRALAHAARPLAAVHIADLVCSLAGSAQGAAAQVRP
jgi:1,2-diacylglycerol 3-beta-galactosyltransferase